MKSWMLYGAYGFTGRLLAAEAVRRGHRPVLAGRDAAKLAKVAAVHDLEWVALDLGDSGRLARAVAPFVDVWSPPRRTFSPRPSST